MEKKTNKNENKMHEKCTYGLFAIEKGEIAKKIKFIFI